VLVGRQSTGSLVCSLYTAVTLPYGARGATVTSAYGTCGTVTSSYFLSESIKSRVEAYSVEGVTGARSTETASRSEILLRLRRYTDKPASASKKATPKIPPERAAAGNAREDDANGFGFSAIVAESDDRGDAREDDADGFDFSAIVAESDDRGDVVTIAVVSDDATCLVVAGLNVIVLANNADTVVVFVVLVQDDIVAVNVLTVVAVVDNVGGRINVVIIVVVGCGSDGGVITVDDDVRIVVRVVLVVVPAHNALLAPATSH
jgi:hypothetical protein